jgi:hypothetical protein
MQLPFVTMPENVLQLLQTWCGPACQHVFDGKAACWRDCLVASCERQADRRALSYCKDNHQLHHECLQWQPGLPVCMHTGFRKRTGLDPMVPVCTLTTCLQATTRLDGLDGNGTSLWEVHCLSTV